MLLPVDPLHTDDEAVMVAFGAPTMVTDLVPDALQPALLVTVTANFTVPDAPAVYLIPLVPLPDVMVPLVMVHT